MAAPGPAGPQPDLDGLWDRIPSVVGAGPSRGHRVRDFREGWRPRHTVALVLLAPVVFAGYWLSVGGGPVTALLVGVLALIGALVLVTYIPMTGRTVLGSSCALVPAVLVPMIGVLLGQPNQLLGGITALALLSLGLWQRVAGSSMCN